MGTFSWLRGEELAEALPAGGFPGGELPGRELPGRELPGRELPGGELPGRFFQKPTVGELARHFAGDEL